MKKTSTFLSIMRRMMASLSLTFDTRDLAIPLASRVHVSSGIFILFLTLSTTLQAQWTNAPLVNTNIFGSSIDNNRNSYHTTLAGASNPANNTTDVAGTPTAVPVPGAYYIHKTTADSRFDYVAVNMASVVGSAHCVPGETGGIVWIDTNIDGVQDVGETSGLEGVTVTLYDCTGAVVATATTDVNGEYNFGTLAFPNNYRIEFSNFPTGYYETFYGTNNGTNVQFISAANCQVNLGANAECTPRPANAILQPGYSIVTCLPGADNVVLAVKDITQLGTLWDTPVNRNVDQDANVPVGQMWTIDQFGGYKLFGITLDQRDGTIYVGTSEMVGDAQHTGGSVLSENVPAQIYKIGPVSTTPVLLATLPGNLGVGGLDIDTLHNQLFATSMENGTIYRVSTATGAILQTYDPFAPDNGTTQVAPPLGEAIWGLGMNNPEQKLYYSVWANNAAFTSTFGPASTNHNVIRSLSIAADGSLTTASDALEMTIPFFLQSSGAATYSEPVSDIEFNAAGTKVLLAESGITTFVGSPTLYSTGAHDARVLEYVKTAGTWVLEPIPSGNIVSKYDEGNVSVYRGLNARGGAAWAYHDVTNNIIGGDESFILTTADAMHLATGSIGDPDWVYGYQMTPASGGNITNSMIVNLGSSSSSGTKYTFNDVEIFKGVACATGVEIGNYVWVDQDGDGVQDACEMPLANVQVNLKQGATVVATTTTNAQGIYTFGGTNDNGFTFESTTTSPQVYTAQITASINDVRQNATDVSAGAGNLSFNSRYLGLRFPDVSIPTGAVITSATIRFTASGAGNINNVTILAEKNPDATPWVLGPGQDLSNRYTGNPTTSTVVWTNPTTWVVGQSGADQTTPDLTSIVAEMVALPTWERDKTINFIFNAPANATGALAYDVAGNSAAGAILTINYTGTAQTTGGSLDPSAAYTICIPLNQTPITAAGLSPTVTNSTVANANDLNDSDGTSDGSNVVLAVTTPAFGADHTFDFGFKACPTITSPMASPTAVCSGTAVTNMSATTMTVGTDAIRFVYFTTPQTDPAIIYGYAANGGTNIGTATPATGTAAISNYTFPANTGASPVVYYVYAILNPDQGVDCRPFVEIQVTINPLPIVMLNDPADVCVDGADMNFTATPAGGAFSTTAATGFTPNNAAGTAVLDVSTAGAGAYTVTYTYINGSGCSATQTVSVTVSLTPDLPAGPLSLSNSCPSPTADLTTLSPTDANNTTGAITYHSTLAGASNPLNNTTDVVGSPAAVTVPGIYYIRKTTTGGCFDYVQVDVTATDCCAPPVLTTVPDAICVGSTINLASLVTGNTPAGTLTFHNTLADATNGVNALVNSIVAPFVTQTYYVRSIIPGGCFATTSMVITVNPLPTPMVSNGSVCVGSSIDLESLVALGAANDSIIFYNTYSDAVEGTNSIASVVSPAIATNYYVRVTSVSGCLVVKEITITLKPTACAPIQVAGPN